MVNVCTEFRKNAYRSYDLLGLSIIKPLLSITRYMGSPNRQDKETYGKRNDDDLEDVKNRREQERKDAIENPDPDEEHQLFQPVPIKYRWYYEYKPEYDDFEYSYEERVEDGDPRGVYRCTCCTYEMSDPEALEHIKKSRSEYD